jgi:hypothetical protein
MEELSRRELMTLKEIYLTGQTSDTALTCRFIEAQIVVDTEVCGLLLTCRGKSLLVRGSPSLWDLAA